MTCDASGLTGNRAGCWQLTGRDGEGPVTGEFRVNFRESEWTSWLPYDVDAGEREGNLNVVCLCFLASSLIGRRAEAMVFGRYHTHTYT